MYPQFRHSRDPRFAPGWCFHTKSSSHSAPFSTTGSANDINNVQEGHSGNRRLGACLSTALWRVVIFSDSNAIRCATEVKPEDRIIKWGFESLLIFFFLLIITETREYEVEEVEDNLQFLS